MNDRPYLSIGEVLELLKHDFPDVSIARIRSYESAGQLELERTASGYRKFYEADIAFLRRLLDGSATLADHASRPANRPTPETRRESSPQRPGAATHQSGHDDHDDTPELGPNGELPGDPERRHPAAFQSLRRELANRAGPQPPVSASSSSVSSPSAPETPPVQQETTVAVPNLALVVTAAGPPQQGLDPSDSAARHSTQPSPAAPVQDPPLLGSANPMATGSSGLNLSFDELISASGLTVETIRELESLGLLKGQGVFSAVYYDEDALLTCKLVASFQRFGVEPRHLRMYKLAADREASFFEQVVTPQLRRRNPDARTEAIETLGELVRLGEQLRTVALRQVLRASIDR
jgi:DNA-binding transcriptional MerR regulator